MDKENPLVSIVLATYNPDLEWLEAQLISLNNQTYPNLELIILDDCSKIISFESIRKLIEESVTKFPFYIYRNEENLGSNRTFQKLTELATGKYISYCDQDDIWENDKIEILVTDLESDSDISLIYSDLSVIDSNGNKTADSLRDIRKRLKFLSGYDLTEGLITKNFVVGCAMIVKSEVAKKAIPFEETMVHDQWIALMASTSGKIEYKDIPLIEYRQHGYNQTGVMTGITDKETYYVNRILYYKSRYESISINTNQNSISDHIKKCVIWINARDRYFKKQNFSDAMIMIKFSSIHRVSVIVELFLPFVTNEHFKIIINLAKKGKI